VGFPEFKLTGLSKFKLPTGKFDDIDMSKTKDAIFGNLPSMSDVTKDLGLDDITKGINISEMPFTSDTDAPMPGFDINSVMEQANEMPQPSDDILGQFGASDMMPDLDSMEPGLAGTMSIDLGDDLSDTKDAMGDIGDISEGLNMSDLRQDMPDLSAELGDIDLGSDLGSDFGIDLSSVTSGGHLDITGIAKSAFGSFMSQLTVENIAADITYRLTNNKWGSMASMFKNMSSLSKKVTGPIDVNSMKSGKFMDTLEATGALDRSKLKGLDKLGTNKSNFQNLAFDSTHILGEGDTADMNIDKIFAKSTVKAFGKDAPGTEDMSYEEIYKSTGMDKFSATEDTKLLKEPVENASKLFTKDTINGITGSATGWSVSNALDLMQSVNPEVKSGNNTISNYMKSGVTDISGDEGGMDLDELMNTGFDFSGEGLDQNSLLADAGIDTTDILGEGSSMMADSQVEMPEVKMDFNASSEKSSSIKDSLYSFAGNKIDMGNLSQYTSALGENTLPDMFSGLSSEVGALNETKSSSGFKMDDFGKMLSEESKEAHSYDDFLKEIRKEDLKHLYAREEE
jgi:hypothetical protein